MFLNYGALYEQLRLTGNRVAGAVACSKIQEGIKSVQGPAQKRRSKVQACNAPKARSKQGRSKFPAVSWVCFFSSLLRRYFLSCGTTIHLYPCPTTLMDKSPLSPSDWKVHITLCQQVACTSSQILSSSHMQRSKNSLFPTHIKTSCQVEVFFHPSFGKACNDTRSLEASA